MMSIIGWIAVIYIFIGCGVMMWFYVYLDKHDRLDGFIDGLCEKITNEIGMKIGEHHHLIEVLFTLLLIMGWVVYILIFICEEILRSRKDRAD